MTKFKILFCFLLLCCFCFRPLAVGQTSACDPGDTNALISLIIAFSCEPQAIYDDRPGGAYHADEGIHSGLEFLPWHSDFIADMENYLLNNGGECYVPLPVWDPCEDIPRLFMRATASCGGIAPPLNATIDCGDFNTSKYSCANLCTFKDFNAFTTALVADHNDIHENVAGGMEHVHNSAYTAIFYLWHKYVDVIYQNYQNVHFNDLEPTLEVVYDDCCEVKISLDDYPCLDYTIDMDGASSIDMSTEGGKRIFTFNKFTGGNKKITLVLDSPCGDSKTFEFTITVDPPTLPQLPAVPPIDLEYVCLSSEEPVCYDFKNIPCLTSLTATPSSFKLNVDVNGTTICLSALHFRRETVFLTVTPGSVCGSGTPQTWKIYLNDSERCKNDDDIFGPRNADNGQLPAPLNLMTVNPNPVDDYLNIEYAVDGHTNGQLQIVDLLGQQHYAKQLDQTKGNTTLSTQQLTPGVYYVLLVDGTKIIDRKRIVKL